MLLAGLSNDRLDQVLTSAQRPKLTTRTVTSKAALLEQIQRVRDQAYALVDQELEPGLRSIAAPIRDASGTVSAAVNLSAHASTTSVTDLRRRLLPPLRAAAAAIERDLRAAAVIV